MQYQPTGRWNFPKCHLPNLATEWKKHSVEALQDVTSCLKFPINTSQAIQSLIPPPPPVPSVEANENAGAAENGDGSDPTTDAAKAVAVGTGAGLAVTGATAAGKQWQFLNHLEITH